MLLLKATERNWGLIEPGAREKRSWKIDSDGTFQMKTTYRPVDPEDPVPEEAEEGSLSPEQMETLRECIDEYWSSETADVCDAESAWEFKLYENGAVVRHRETGYIDGIEPFSRIAALLESLPDEEM